MIDVIEHINGIETEFNMLKKEMGEKKIISNLHNWRYSGLSISDIGHKLGVEDRTVKYMIRKYGL